MLVHYLLSDILSPVSSDVIMWGPVIQSKYTLSVLRFWAFPRPLKQKCLKVLFISFTVIYRIYKSGAHTIFFPMGSDDVI